VLWNSSPWNTEFFFFWLPEIGTFYADLQASGREEKTDFSSKIH